MIKGTYLFIIFTHHRMNEYERIYDRTCLLLNDFIQPLFSFQSMHFRIPFAIEQRTTEILAFSQHYELCFHCKYSRSYEAL